MIRYVVYVDAGKRGLRAEGPAACGAILSRIEKGGSRRHLFEKTEFLGQVTINSAEYHAVLLGLEMVITYWPQIGSETSLYSDSQLVVKQIHGDYRINSPWLQDLCNDTHQLIERIREMGCTIEISHIRRGKNKAADALVRKFMDEQQSTVDIVRDLSIPIYTPDSSETYEGGPELTMSPVGDTIRTRMQEVETELGEHRASLAEVQAHIDSLESEQNRLDQSLKIIEGRMPIQNGTSHAGEGQIDNETILKVVREATSPMTTRQIAEVIGCDSRKIGRKLVKLRDEGEISGDATDGYAA